MIQGANHAFHDVVDVGEIAAMVAVIENVDGLSGEYLLGEDKDYEISMENCRNALNNSRYWSEFFEIYDVPKILELPL